MTNLRRLVAALGGVAIAAALLPLPLAASERHGTWLGWGRVRSFLRGGPLQDSNRGRDGGSRGGGLCLINPGQGEVVWTVQPLLLLRGNLQSTALYVAEAEEPFWRAAIVPSEDLMAQLPYDGEPLQPGTTYEQQVRVVRFNYWVVSSRRYAFQVMPEGEQRAQIDADLAQLDAELTQAKDDAEAIALARAEFFFERDLTADALQALFSVAAPSAELLETRQAIVDTVCDQDLPR